MGLFFQKSEMLCVWKNGLSLSMLCRGSFPEKPGGWVRQRRCRLWQQHGNDAQFVRWDRAQRGHNKWGEQGLLKIWQSLCHGSTLTHTLMSSSWQSHCWDILPQSKVLQEDLGSPEAELQWRSELCVSCWARSPSAARWALGDWWRLLLCPAAQVIANLQLAVLQTWACYRP